MLNKIKYTLLSMLTVFKHLFKRPVTLEYPEKRKDIGEHFRGKPVVKNGISYPDGACFRSKKPGDSDKRKKLARWRGRVRYL